MFKIGEFSRLVRVSVRMLRYYDQMGLLTPSRTDPVTRYRYYAVDQLPRLNRILALQDLGFSLQQIRDLLGNDLDIGELRGMLKLKRLEVEQGIETELARLARLEARIRQMDAESGRAHFDVVLRRTVPQLAATWREVALSDEGLQTMFEKLEAYVATHAGARADKPPFTIYYDAEYREQDIDAEVGVPIQFAIPENESVRVRELPALECAACVTHTGAYGTLYEAYNELLRWIEANHYRMAGPIREVYIRYGAGHAGLNLPQTHVTERPEDYVTELQLPVERVTEDHE